MDWLGLGKRTQLPERWTAALGALLAVLAVFLASGWALGEENLVVATSMGSSAVLLFSTPHSPLSQPWPLVGGHVLAADSRCGVCIVSRDGPAVSRFGSGDCSACDAVDKKYASPRGSHSACCGNRWRCRDRPRLVVRVEAGIVERYPIANCWFGF